TRKQYVPMQQALSSKDAMMEYVQHTGSAHFAVPPGLTRESSWADALFS
ncbi:deferrochelatase/peroxidase EfeB, partial [Amycolatopsis sp. NPDC051128]